MENSAQDQSTVNIQVIANKNQLSGGTILKTTNQNDVKRLDVPQLVPISSTAANTSKNWIQPSTAAIRFTREKCIANRIRYLSPRPISQSRRQGRTSSIRSSKSLTDLRAACTNDDLTKKTNLNAVQVNRAAKITSSSMVQKGNERANSTKIGLVKRTDVIGKSRTAEGSLAKSSVDPVFALAKKSEKLEKQIANSILLKARGEIIYKDQDLCNMKRQVNFTH